MKHDHSKDAEFSVFRKPDDKADLLKAKDDLLSKMKVINNKEHKESGGADARNKNDH